MRKNATEAEKKLWYELREFKKGGHYFRRQVPIGKFITDFACLKAKLIVELDGGHHTESTQSFYDDKRDEWLRSEGYTVLRFFNHQVFKDKQAVLNTIHAALPLEGGGASEGGGGGDAPQQGQRQ